MFCRNYAQGTLIKEKWSQTGTVPPKLKVAARFWQQPHLIVLWCGTCWCSNRYIMHQLSASFILLCFWWREKLGRTSGTLFDFRSHPRSIHLCPIVIYVVFSLPFLWSLFSGAESNESVMNIRGRAASSHVLEARAPAHASRVAASEPVPQNGLPEWQWNWKLLKYLNIRSLRDLPCNYTCSYHISANSCPCTLANTDRSAPCVGAHVSRCLHTTCVCAVVCFWDWIWVCVC